MRPSRLFAWWFPVVMMVLGAGVVFGQTTSTGSGQAYPNKPIRLVTSEPGGGNDFISRILAQGISGPLGQNVIVDNRGSAIAGEMVSRAPPDGYTLLVAGSTFVLGPLLQKTPYDPLGDFSPISMLTKSPSILALHPSVAANSVKELVALAKARPGQLNYASSGTGGSNHLGAELFKAMAGVDVVRINYKGTGPALNALLGGEVQLMFVTAASAAPHVKSGRLKGLAVTGSEPSLLAPGLPTVAASGLPDYESVSIIGMFAPAKTPAPIINRLNQEIVRVLNQPEVKEKFLSAGVEIVGSSPEVLAARMKSEIARIGKLIKDVGIKAQ